MKDEAVCVSKANLSDCVAMGGANLRAPAAWGWIQQVSGMLKVLGAPLPVRQVALQWLEMWKCWCWVSTASEDKAVTEAKLPSVGGRGTTDKRWLEKGTGTG